MAIDFFYEDATCSSSIFFFFDLDKFLFFPSFILFRIHAILLEKLSFLERSNKNVLLRDKVLRFSPDFFAQL